jgi:DNA repair exonuclease SbcCD ATPase subunit
MIIKSLKLQGAGPLQDHSFELLPNGINVILGPNESGKTTFGTAIVAVIHGVNKDVNLQHSTSGGSIFNGYLNLQIDDSEYQIFRNFETDQVRISKIVDDGQEILFEGNANPRGRTEEPKLYRRIIENDLGLPSASVIRNSSFVDQLDLYMEIDEELRKQISGAGQSDYMRAAGSLRDSYYLLTSSPLPGDKKRSKNREIEDLKSELEDLNDEYDESRLKAENVSTKLGEQSELDEEVNDYQILVDETSQEQKAIDQYHNIIEKYNTYKDQKELHEKTKENIDQLKQALEANEKALSKDKFAPFQDLSEDELKSLRKYVQSDAESTWMELGEYQAEETRLDKELKDSRYKAFKNAPDDTGGLLRSLQNQRAGLSRVEEVLESIPSGKKGSPRRLLWLIPVLLASLGLPLGYYIGMWLLPSITDAIPLERGALIAGGIVAFLALLAGFVIVILIRATRKSPERRQIEAEAKLRDIESEINRLEEELEPVLRAVDEGVSLDVLLDRCSRWEELKGQQERIRENIDLLQAREALQIREDPKLTEILDQTGASVLEGHLVEFNELKAGIQAASDTLQGLSTSEELQVIDPEKLEGNLQETLLHLTALEREYPTFKTLKEDEGKRLKKLQEMNELMSSREGDLEELKKSLIDTDKDLAVEQALTIRDPILIMEEIEEQEEVLRRLILRSAALETAVTVLNEAITEYEHDHLGRLSDITSDIFSTFTRGRYERVDILAGGTIQVYEPKGEPLVAELLSVGARDQLYLAIRIAVTDLLSSEMKLPFLFDDSFVNFDKSRLTAAKDVLSQISEDRQVILLSHDEEYRDWGDKVINL